MPFDCNSYEWIEGSKDFCVNELGAFFYCSPNVAYIGCYCDMDKPVIGDYPWYEEEQDGGDVVTYCDAGLTVPQGVWDAGGWCADYPCSDGSNCDNYFDAEAGYHHCACTDTWFCVTCYEHSVTNDCECPPNSVKELIYPDVGPPSEFRCVPPEGCP